MTGEALAEGSADWTCTCKAENSNCGEPGVMESTGSGTVKWRIEFK